MKPVKETPDENAKYQAQFANWPIVAQWTEPDGTTYTFRQAPPGYKPDPADLEADCSTLIPASENATLLPEVRNDVAPATIYNCQWVTDSYGTAKFPVWKDGYRITQFVDTWANVYCHNQDCVEGPIFFKLKAYPKAWWTRTSTKWTVANAVHTCGNYSVATKCDGNQISRIVEGGFTVDWYDNTQSWVYKWPMPNPPWVAITEQVGFLALSQGDCRREI